MDVFMHRCVGVAGYIVGLVLLTGLLGGRTPVMATNTEPVLLTMSLFSQDPPTPPVAKPKAAVPRQPDSVGKAGIVAPPAAAPQTPGTAAPVQAPAGVTAPGASAPVQAPAAATAPGAPASVQAPGAATVAGMSPVAALPGPSVLPRPADPAAPSALPVGAGPMPLPGSPPGHGRAEADDPTGLPAPLVDGYTYDPQSRRDPFQSMVKLLKLNQAKGELPPLQRLELNDVKLIGIVSDASGYYGLIQTPDGKGYTVRVGTLMGTNNGTIKTISEQRIVVAEPIIGITGKMTTRDVEILHRPKEGAE
jgi:type IV pilus assembly protein PilP